MHTFHQDKWYNQSCFYCYFNLISVRISRSFNYKMYEKEKKKWREKEKEKGRSEKAKGESVIETRI